MLHRVSYALALAITLSGCASTLSRAAHPDEPKTPVASQPTPVPDDHTYAALVDALPDPGAHPLSGRTIVVDPGHGGSETGAVGPAGIMEKDVNLAVGRRLAELLRGAGARVILTREGDTQVAPPGSSLAQDLKARIDKANAVHADLFVSVHHNATLDPLNERNQTETYYKMDDPGPSEDAGRAIHRHLLRNLNLPQEKMLPGNYAVLRAANVPAVLGEASYLSNAYTEQKLQQPAKQLLEAEAYFAGILDYFAHGTPSIPVIDVQDASLSVRPLMTAQLDGGGSAIDPASVALVLDGEKCASYFDAARGHLVYQPAGPLSNGPHVLTLSARNLAGNSTPLKQSTFVVDRPAANLSPLRLVDSVPTEGPMPLMVRVTDGLGMSVADGTLVQWSAAEGRFDAPQTPTHEGLAFNTLQHPQPGVLVTAHTGTLEARCLLPSTKRPLLHGQVTGPDGKGLGAVTVVAFGATGSRMATSDEQGYWLMEAWPQDLRKLKVLRAGSPERAIELKHPTYVTARLEGAIAPSLLGQTIYLNPEGGIEDRDPLRKRLSGYNYMVADQLRGYLEAAGARVFLTRGPDENPSDIQRVRSANVGGATLFLTIGHRTGDRVVTNHYPRSAKGQQIAGAIREALLGALDGSHDGGTEPDSSYTLIETTCPSVTVLPGAVTPGADDTQAHARREAYGILLGLMPTNPQAAALTVHVVRSGHPLPDALVTADGAWVGQTDDRGTWRFGDLMPCAHRLSVGDGRVMRRLSVPKLAPGERRDVVVDLERS